MLERLYLHQQGQPHTLKTRITEGYKIINAENEKHVNYVNT